MYAQLKYPLVMCNYSFVFIMILLTGIYRFKLTVNISACFFVSFIKNSKLFKSSKNTTSDRSKSNKTKEMIFYVAH